MGGRGDRGGHRGGRGRRRKIVEIRLVAAVDHVDGVVDSPLHHGEMDDRHGRPLSGVRHRSVRYVHERLDRVLVPVEHCVLRRSRLRWGADADEEHGNERGDGSESRPRELWLPSHFPSPFVIHPDVLCTSLPPSPKGSRRRCAASRARHDRRPKPRRGRSHSRSAAGPPAGWSRNAVIHPSSSSLPMIPCSLRNNRRK